MQNAPEKQEKYLNIIELAKLLSVPKSWLYKRTHHNEIPHFKLQIVKVGSG